MNLAKTILVILNTLCGFIQIGIVFIAQPFGYWLFPIPLIIGFVLGYKDILGNYFKGDRNEAINAGVLFLVNLAFFVLLGVVYFDPASDAVALTLILTTMMLATISNFEGFGRLIGNSRSN